MKIAIHKRIGSFSDRWIEYCINNNITYVTINCLDWDIIKILKQNKITHLLWHINHSSSSELQSYHYLLNSIEQIGIKTFPDFKTRWHFDDKIAQKYLFEAIGNDMVDSYVFYSEEKAYFFLDKLNYPVVGKLRKGAGSSNVQLLNNKEECQKYIKRLFSSGIHSYNGGFKNLNQKIRIARGVKNPIHLFQKIIHYLKKSRKEKQIRNTEKGYFYFQKFLPKNKFDTRVIVIGNIAFAVRRFNRKNDFRASGSGKSDYNNENIDVNLIKKAFVINDSLKMQSAAFDFIYDETGLPKIVEVCFGFNVKFYDPCPGYWNRDLIFVKKQFNPQYIMIENLINE